MSDYNLETEFEVAVEAPQGCAVWIESLNAYNSGRSVGRWVELDGLSEDELQEIVAEILQRGGNPGGDWAIHDYDNFGGELPSMLGETPGLANLLKLAALVEEHGAELVAGAADAAGLEADDIEREIQDNYQGEYDSLQAFAEELLEETGELQSIPERLRYYFDYEAYARDLDLGGDVRTADSPRGVYVFWNH